MSDKIIKQKKQMIIGTQDYLNQQTGEVETFTVAKKLVNADFNFHKVWLGDLLHIMNNFGNKKIQIFSFLLGEMRNEDNSISVTYRYITDQTKISYKTVAETMKELQESGVIKKDKSKGCYFMNPDLLVKGGSDKRKNLLIQYDYIDTSAEEIALREEDKLLEK